MKVEVLPIDKRTADVFVTTKHYSKRAGIFWAGFALVIDGMIEGIVVYGQPSAPIQRHAFKGRDFRLYELSRLIIQTPMKNAASILVGRSLQMLPKPCAVVSYADSEWGHVGVIYQATNWLYTGSTVSHDHAYIVEGRRIHPMTLREQGITDPKRWARENNIQTVPPMRKHRYFTILAHRKDRKRIRDMLFYPVIADYPKAPAARYDDGPRLIVPYGQAMMRPAGGRKVETIIARTIH